MQNNNVNVYRIMFTNLRCLLLFILGLVIVYFMTQKIYSANFKKYAELPAGVYYTIEYIFLYLYFICYKCYFGVL